jgi:hypothetical protein
LFDYELLLSFLQYSISLKVTGFSRFVSLIKRTYKKNIMEHILHKPFLGLLLALVLSTVAAQQGVVSSGGEVTGTTGNVSFSIGQVFFAIQTGPDGTAVQGLQQPYEISVVTGIDEAEGIQLLFTAYPIPVTDMLTLKMEGIALERIPSLIIHLFDISGKYSMCQQAEGMETRISMTHMAPGVYFLQVIDTGGINGNTGMKTFKIIKNQ